MYEGIVLSFFDYTGSAVRDWAEAGYLCFCFDLQHESMTSEVWHVRPNGDFGGKIVKVPADLNPGASGWQTAHDLVAAYAPDTKRGLSMVFGWPPCEDLTASGARHFAAKREADPSFQMRAVERAMEVEAFADSYGAPFMVENPVGRLCTLWRRPNVIWNPFEFGGYLPEDDVHPRHPRYIAARDAYTKKTGCWCGNGFTFPAPRKVTPEVLERVTKSGRTIRGSRQFMKLGGKSIRTKNIRNETPRGFARAVFLANARQEA